MAEKKSTNVRAVSGAWRFEEGLLRSGSVEIDPPTIDFWERWTFARFLDDQLLALAFESSQPWSENGSYGDRYGGIEILALQNGAWRPVALEFDYRAHDEEFVPLDVVWHPRGLLAWLREGELAGQLLPGPRPIVEWDLLPKRDSDHGPAVSFGVATLAVEVAVDRSGRWLTARGPDEWCVLDVDQARLARVGRQSAPDDLPPDLDDLAFESVESCFFRP